MKKTNCLFWAWKKWKRDGGYLCFRKSEYWPGPHVLWLKKEGNKFLHYSPLKRFYGGKRLKWWQVLRLIRFNGKIKEGDNGKIPKINDEKI